MEDWIVVDDPVVPAARAVESNAQRATPKGESPKPVLAHSPENETQLDASECGEPAPTDRESSEQPLFRFADAVRNMTDIQRAGLGLYDLYSDQLQETLHDFKEAATTRSRWALERARLETQRMMAALSATEVSRYLAQMSVESSDQTSVLSAGRSGLSADTASQKQDAPLEQGASTIALEKWLGAELVPVLFEAKIPLFDGRDVKEWFAKVSPHFDLVMRPQQTCALTVMGFKLYSLPSVAATIDEIDFSGLSSPEEAVDALSHYFNEKRARTRRYKELLRTNTQLCPRDVALC